MNLKLGREVFVAGDYVHLRCRPRYQLPVSPEPLTSRSSRSHSQFNFRNNCLFCGVVLSSHPRKQKDIHSVSNPTFGKSLESVITERDYDDWAVEVRIV